MDNELYHYGIRGMRWGVRRFQNKDGSLTSAGRKRQKSKGEEVHEDYKKAHSKESIKSMSDSELRSRNNRLQMERQYSMMTQKIGPGKKVVSAFISTAGTIAAVEGAYKIYKRVADAAIDKVGDLMMKDLARGLSKGI